MRRKKNLHKRLERVSSLIVSEPSEMKGNWSKVSHLKPIHLEIGCGKGRFICQTAEANPDIFYVAMEKAENVLVTAVETAFERKLSNVLFICGDAMLLNEYFAQGEVSRLYLNFSDPWPVNRHRNRRLTSETFLKTYSEILSSNAMLFLKTDNKSFFDFSLEELRNCSWRITNFTYDLHGSYNTDMQHDTQIKYNPIGGVVTEYEERFSSMGTPICRLEARPPL